MKKYFSYLLIVGAFIIVLGSWRFAVAATSLSFLQTSWSGGATSTVATDVTGWNYYSTSTNLDFSTSSIVRLTSSTYTFSDDVTSTSSGSVTSSGFSSGTVSQVSLINPVNNPRGYLALSTTTQDLVEQFDTLIPAVPGRVAVGQMVVTGTYAYVFQAVSGATGTVHRYDYDTNSWVSFASLPGTFTAASMALDSNYIYVTRGSSTSTYRHTLASTSSAWEAFTALPVTSGADAAIAVDGNYIYVLPTGATSFYRHTVTNTSANWESYTVLPATAGTGGRLLIDSNYAYVFVGANSSSSYRHDLTVTSSAWESFPGLPQLVSTGSAAAIDSNYIYIIAAVTTGASTNTYRHAVANTSSAWEGFLQLPGSVSGGPQIIADGTYLYVVRGSTNVYRHVLVNTSSAWDTYPSLVSSVSSGSGVGLTSSSLQVLQGNTDTGFFRHTLADTSSPWVGTHQGNFAPAPSTINGNANNLFVINEHYLYLLAGGGTGFYRHDLFSTSSAWTSYAALPLTLGNGSSAQIDDTFAYVHRGSSNSVYRHALTSTAGSWETFASLPSSTASNAVFKRKDDYLYVLQGAAGTAVALYRHTTANTSSAWDTFIDLPAALGSGCTMIFNDDYVYVVRGGSSSSTYRHDLSSTSSAWETLANTPGNITGSSESHIAIDDSYLYVQQLGSTGFYRHTLADTSTSWESFTTLPGSSGTRAALLLTDQHAYMVRGGNNTSFYRHTLANTSSAWENLAMLPAGLTSGSSVALSMDGDVMYVARGSATTDTYRYVINDRTYNSSGTFTSVGIPLAAARLNEISWSSSTPVAAGSSSLRIQVATSSDNVAYSSFVGPDGTSSSYFCDSNTTTLSGAIASRAEYVKYKAYLATSNTDFSPRLNAMSFSYFGYATGGTLISSIFDSTRTNNKIATVEWVGEGSGDSTVQMQIRTGADESAVTSAEWVGPDNSTSTYFVASSGETLSSIFKDGSGDQFVQVRAYFSSNGAISPGLTSLVVYFSSGGSANYYSPPLSPVGTEVPASVMVATTSPIVTVPASTTSSVPIADPVSSTIPEMPALPEAPTVVIAPPTSISIFINKNLKPGSRDRQVLDLQKALNKLGFIVVKSGPGSPGKETNVFGNATRAAVIRFQEKNSALILRPLNLKKGTGVVGPATQSLLNSLMQQIP